MSEAAEMVWGQPYDLPCFTIAYNILLQMGIYANVQVENPNGWMPQTSQTPEDAYCEMKSKLGLGVSETIYDDYLRRLVDRRLVRLNGQFIWPEKMQSALIFWRNEKN